MLIKHYCQTFNYGIDQVWPPVRDQEPHFFTVLRQRTTSYTWAHMNIKPSLPHSHKYLCLAGFIVNITHQHDNDRTLQSIYCYASYLVGLLLIT